MKAVFLSFALFFTFAVQGGKCADLARRIFRSASTALHLSLDAVHVIHQMEQLMLMPQRKLAVGPGIEVVGSFLSSKRSGELVIQSLEDFDRAMKSAGLEKSTVTKIYIPKEKPLLQNSFLGNYFKVKLINLWRKSEAGDLIIMRPNRHFRLAEHPYPLFHERGHSILIGMYEIKAFVHSNIPLQEGLADFLAAHYMGVPKLRYSDNFIFNISKVPPLPLTTHFYRSGKVFSHILWKLRERIGPEAMTSLLRPFLDGLNQYYESFARGRKAGKSFVLKPEYNYFMAVLKRTLQEQGRLQEADEFIVEITSRLKLDGDLIDELAGSIMWSNEDFYNRSKFSFFNFDDENGAMLAGLSFFTNQIVAWIILLEGLFIYWLLTLFF